MEIPTSKLESIKNIYCSLLTTLTLYPEGFEIYEYKSEDPYQFQESSVLVQELYEKLFIRNVFN